MTRGSGRATNKTTLEGARIAIDSSVASSPAATRGLGRYLSAVAATADDAEWEYHRLGEDRRVARPGFVGMVRRGGRLQAARRQWDVFHATSPTEVALPIDRSRCVASILDIIPLDVRSYRRLGLKARVAFALATQSRAVLTLSAYSAARIADRLGTSPADIVVAPLPPAPAFRSTPAGCRTSGSPSRQRPYVLALADYFAPDPRKRLPWLERVAGEISSLGVSLVLVGRPGLLAPSGPGTNIDMVGPVPDHELAELYRGAECVVFPSAYEGQGLPIVEAMACGAVPIAHANTSLEEVVGAGGILLGELDADPCRAANGPHAPGDEGADQLAQAVRSFLTADAATHALVRTQALAHAATFTGERFRAGLRAAYRTVFE